LSSVVKYGGAMILGLALFLVSRGLAASAPGASDIQVDPAKAQAEPPPTAVATASPLLPPGASAVAATPLDADFQPSFAQLTTPAGLRELVAMVAEDQAPLRPDVECIARTVFREAANQALPGQLAVAQVVVNRTRSGAFPRGACAVVGQRGQFSQNPVEPSAGGSTPWDRAVAIATIAEDDRIPQVAPGALFFHAASMRPAWSDERERIVQIGAHIFYR
jgi:spore germination cell wall hydrolase CwlJ-like protein